MPAEALCWLGWTMADLLGLPIPQKGKRSTRARPREKTPATGAQARAPAALRRCVSRGEASFLYCLSPSTETAPAADAVQPSARTPPTRTEEAAAGQALLELPVAHRTRNSPLLLAAAAHTEGDGLALALPNAVQTIMVTVNLRTAEQLERKRGDGFRLHPGCPQGPWQAHDEAKRAVKLWAMSKQDGSWGVTWVKGEDPGNSRRGPQRFLACAQHTRFRCGWRGTLEQTTAGWMWNSFSEHTGGEGKPPALGNGHSHALDKTTGQRLADATQREIPVELHDWARTMRLAGCGIKEIENTLREHVQRAGGTPAFVYGDVRRLVAPGLDPSWDAVGFIERLGQRHEEGGLAYDVSLDEDGKLRDAFWVMPDAYEIYAGGCVAWVYCV